MERIASIMVSVIQSRLDSITKEMGRTMLRTSRSPIFNEARDFVTAIFDGKGRLLAQTEYIPILLAATPFAVRATMDFFGQDIHEGDVFLLNDPYQGNNHLPDITVLKPVFYKDEIQFWTVAKGHHADVGGMTAGGYSPKATEIWQEGIRIPPVKIYEKGELRKDMWNLILTNVRMLETVRGDLRSQVGATKIGERGVLSLLEKYGVDTLFHYIEFMLDSGEERMQKEIRKIPKGVYKSERTIDHDGIKKDKRVTIKLTLTVEEDSIIYDYTGTDDQVEGFINSSLPNTISGTYISLFTSVDPDIPHNEGATRPIRVIVPEGCLLNPRLPAPMTLCTLTTGEALVEVGWKALSQAIPEDISAGWNRSCGPTFVGLDPRTGQMFTDLAFLGRGGGGAIYGFDGWNHLGTVICCGGLRSPDIEMHEIQYPSTILQHEYLPDSGGAGKWKGGLGVIYRWRCEIPSGIVTTTGDGQTDETRAFGLAKGKDGGRNRVILSRASGEKLELDSKGIYSVQYGDILETLSGGGGGWGDPCERSAEQVREDIIDGYISLERAEKDYGVVLNPTDLEIDEEATQKYRERKKMGSEEGGRKDE